MDGLPVAEYIVSKSGDIRRSASSHIAFSGRSGWSFGTRFSGDSTVNISPCFVSAPRMPTNYPAGSIMSIFCCGTSSTSC